MKPSPRDRNLRLAMIEACRDRAHPETYDTPRLLGYRSGWRVWGGRLVLVLVAMGAVVIGMRVCG